MHGSGVGRTYPSENFCEDGKASAKRPGDPGLGRSIDLRDDEGIRKAGLRVRGTFSADVVLASCWKFRVLSSGEVHELRRFKKMQGEQ